MKNELQRNAEIANQQLIEMWVESLTEAGKGIVEVPIENKDIFIDLLLTAQREQKTLVFMAIGCPDWIKPEWGDPTHDRLIGEIDKKNKRGQRFSQEIALFQQALTSFNIPHRIHFSLSNVELAMQIELKNMGLEIHSMDPLNNLAESMNVLVENVQDLGGRIEPFDHLELVRQLLQEDDLALLQSIIARSSAPTMREFLDALYAFDVTQTAPALVNDDEIGPVILDTQTFEFTDDVIALRTAAKKLDPDLPILAIFSNAGNWHAAPSPLSSIMNKKEFLADQLEIPFKENPEEIAQQLLNQSDATVVRFLENLGHSLTIENHEEKLSAIQMLMLIAYNWDPLPFLEAAKNQTEQVIVDSSLRILDIVRNLAGINKKEALNLFSGGKIKVNGNPAIDPYASIQEPIELQIGKKRQYKLILAGHAQ